METEQLEVVRQTVIHGRLREAAPNVQAALAAGLTAVQLLEGALVPAMDEVGRRYECGEFFVPEMMAAAKVMQASLRALRPLLVRSGIEPLANVVLGTVQGDMHDIGKNLVGLMLEGAGFEVIDLGTNVPPERFVEAVGNGADLVGISALLTTTMTNMPAVLEALAQARLRSAAKVIVGGAPLTQAFADEIGADGYAPDASRAVTLVRGLLK